jgi:predicted Zn-dependent peptidase
MKRFLIYIIILTTALAANAVASNPRDMKFPPLKFEPPEPERFVLDNGLIVYFLADHQLPIITAQAMFKGGTSSDPADKIGLVEMTAVLLRTGGAGNRTAEQIDEDLDFVGASISSEVSADNASVGLRALKKDVQLGMEIMADIIRRPNFDTSKISLELSNKQDEIRRQNDDPGMLTRRIYYQILYAGHPYGNFATLASIANINREAMIAQHKKIYNPDNCILAISGDLTLEETRDLVNKYFGDWPRGSQVVEPIAKAEQRYAPGVYYVRKDINQANIRMGHLCIDDKNPDRHALEVLNFALGGGGFSSRLTGQIRTAAGLAYSVGSYLFARPSNGNLFAYCQTRADAMSQATKMMIDIFKQVKDSGIAQAELDLAKESIVNNFVFNYATSDQIVNAKAMLELTGFPPDQMKKDMEAYQAVTLDDCRRVAAKYLQPDNMVIVITGNKELFDGPMDSFGTVTEVDLEIK